MVRIDDGEWPPFSHAELDVRAGSIGVDDLGLGKCPRWRLSLNCKNAGDVGRKVMLCWIASRCCKVLQVTGNDSNELQTATNGSTQHERNIDFPVSFVVDTGFTVGLIVLALLVLAASVFLAGAIFVSAKANKLGSSID